MPFYKKDVSIPECRGTLKLVSYDTQVACIYSSSPNYRPQSSLVCFHFDLEDNLTLGIHFVVVCISYPGTYNCGMTYLQNGDIKIVSKL